MEKLCKYLVLSLDSESPIFSYIGVALIRDNYILWIYQLKSILRYCLLELEDLHPEQPTDNKSILLRLHTLVSFTSTQTWSLMRLSEMQKLKVGMNQLCANIMRYLMKNDFYKIMKNLLIKGLCRQIITLQPTALAAITTLTLRPLLFSKISDKLFSVFIINIISVPALVCHLNDMDRSPSISLFKQNNLFVKSIKFLNNELNAKTIFSILKRNYTLYLLANLIELANIEYDRISNDIYYPDFTFVITSLLEFCQQSVIKKKCNTTYWHPIIGWLEQPEEFSFHEVMPKVKKQLSYLWTGKIITHLICEPLEEFVGRDSWLQLNSESTSATNFVYKVFSEVKMKKKKQYYKLDSQNAIKISLIYLVIVSDDPTRFTKV
ncbi:PREDICTED: ubiquitin-protein ligase E3B-like [Ceratosolen solmsi marchali]|uniref:HECT-type E3 ubiquitin transferase n=1 Tax=Ceratosolen solmsi marchali TaxID=326594 RepID=A0AAJ6YTH5_9HYME|nr:PREDICTED: ubiquitin-protein ligase E3B-like [Ceratosolen solmsi marchali]